MDQRKKKFFSLLNFILLLWITLLGGPLNAAMFHGS